MKAFLAQISLLSVLFLAGCTGSHFNSEVPITSQEPILFSNEDYTVFGSAYELSFTFQEQQRFDPTKQEVEAGLQILEDHLKDRPEIKPLDQYKIQLAGYLNKEGNKLLWANYVCSDQLLDEEFFDHGHSWKMEWVFMRDGGNCFFNIKVNLDTQETFDFIVNGDA